MESVTKTHISGETLASIVGSRLGVELLEHEELKDGWFNSTYALTLSDGRKMVLKAAPPDHVPVLRYERDILRSELKVMTLLLERTNIPIPVVYFEDFSRELVNLDYYVMDWLPGAILNVVQESLPEKELGSIRSQVGETIRTINSIEGERFGMVANPQYSNWREAFVGLMEDIALDGESSAVDLDYDAIRRSVERHSSSLEVAETAYLVHWDMWEGNIGVKDGSISGVIDFERAFWGDPLMEMNWMAPTPEFVEGYGTDLRNQSGAKERRLLYDLHLFTIMQVEAWYRQFTDLRGVHWAQERFAETMAALS